MDLGSQVWSVNPGSVHTWLHHPPCASEHRSTEKEHRAPFSRLGRACLPGGDTCTRAQPPQPIPFHTGPDFLVTEVENGGSLGKKELSPGQAVGPACCVRKGHPGSKVWGGAGRGYGVCAFHPQGLMSMKSGRSWERKERTSR